MSFIGKNENRINSENFCYGIYKWKFWIEIDEVVFRKVE